MKYISLFSGIEAATVAWKPLGWECVAVSEIDPFACAVLKHHYPNTPNLGDITKITKKQLHDIKKIHTNIDILIGGSPCQSFSVAGLRKGLNDPRGNLMLEYIRVVDIVKPTYFIWENVPGALSSNKGRDFGTLIQSMAELGYSLAWRTLDSKNFGVPQRRRRVFLVGCLGNNKRPFEILFEPKSSQRNHPKSKETRQNNTSKTTTSTEEHDRIFLTNTRSEVRYSGGDGLTAGCISASSGTNQTNYLMTKTPASTQEHDKNTFRHSSFASYTESHIGGTLKANGGDFLGGETLVTEKHDKITIINPAQPSNPPKVTHHAPSLIARMGTGGNQVPLIVTEKQYASTLCARDHKGIAADSFGTDYQQAVIHNSKVRRLTLIECERLQGFPDNYTQIPWRNKEAKDCPMSHRYRCLGNSMTTNVIKWIGQRIANIPTTICQSKKKTKTYCIQGRIASSPLTSRQNGSGWIEDTCFTLSTHDIPAITTVGKKI